MTQSNWLTMIIAAGVIAATTSFFLVPRLDRSETANSRGVSTQAPPAPAPSPAAARSFANAAVITREADGHYWTRAEVDDTAVKFMVDTGASTVALTYRDAQRIGLDPESLEFKWEIRTAGGITYGASVLLGEVRIGRVKVENVEAMILKDSLDQSLLGMTFLGELESYEFRKKQLIIRQ